MAAWTSHAGALSTSWVSLSAVVSSLEDLSKLNLSHSALVGLGWVRLCHSQNATASVLSTLRDSYYTGTLSWASASPIRCVMLSGDICCTLFKLSAQAYASLAHACQKK